MSSNQLVLVRARGTCSVLFLPLRAAVYCRFYASHIVDVKMQPRSMKSLARGHVDVTQSWDGLWLMRPNVPAVTVRLGCPS